MPGANITEKNTSTTHVFTIALNRWLRKTSTQTEIWSVLFVVKYVGYQVYSPRSAINAVSMT